MNEPPCLKGPRPRRDYTRPTNVDTSACGLPGGYTSSDMRISRRKLTRFCLVVVAITLVVMHSLASAAAPATSLAPERPNVVLIISDDQGWGDFGFMGHPIIRTPRLDALAARSAVFPNGYVPTSLCRAS